MHNKERLIEYLKKISTNKFISAKELADILNVTDRTIRNYVKAINQQGLVSIEVSRLGYKYSNPSETNSTIQNHSINSRRFYILRQLFKNASKGVDVFDLSDTLYLSDASIRSDLFALNKLANRYDVNIRQNNGRYTLEGATKNKRQLMIQLISPLQQDGLAFEADIQNFLDTIPLDYINTLTKRAFERYDLPLNTYFLRNFILHLVIAIDRAKGSQIVTSIDADSLKIYKSFRAIAEIQQAISKQFHVDLLLDDIKELNILYEGEYRQENFDVLQFVEPDVLHSLDRALNEISNIYLIDFSDNQFKSRLLLHVQNLYKRSKEKKVSRNLSLMEIKVKYPVLFDVAVYLSSVLSSDLNITISDDEIAFLALHIGSFMENQQKKNKQIKAVIITPRYNLQEKQMKEKIEDDFGNELTIVDMIEDLLELDLTVLPELIISTQVSLKKDYFLPPSIAFITIKEFITPQDMKIIRKKIEQIKHQKYQTELTHILPRLIPEGFYMDLNKSITKEAIFELISSTFQSKNYVPAGYKAALEERENLSATSFPSGIAVPHAIKYMSYKTGFIIIHSKKPIEWADNQVHLIIALSVDKNNSEEFNQIFPRMIELLADELNVNYLKKNTNRADFISALIQLMVSDGYYSE
ncbi:BglG family transcription antiterminator [Listeria immobilis]|uniref:BglG family transcription antiterminator n=1 Tax=Listeria immobilis TaxID=2713502 RepID=A0ABR6SSR0_9LIST|nr:PTS sugar transporter subunit IIA [Listeria immobilis]MBC1482708.1 BglG family transcription antiterminator [Listeria immobilis]MBC1506078.1 BglG family transcription antiterminator [Listeria immobilis]MBC1508722.1 BglG family transcription antiterminator [Listeria immobilis]MBC1516012.1 BglG family transcription antiterminator [Listeria immobilis]MBC6303084.1 BglG family transcription antiterminator [Listeria immobilis]